MLKSVRTSAGNVILQILVATAVMGTSFYFLTNYVIGQKEQVGKTANLVNLRFALNSTMDYVIFGVRQKYCFTNDDMLLNDTPDKCNLSHSGSIERLIMSAEQENYIRNLVSSGQSVGPVDVNNISLPEIHRYIRISSASSNHPLFPVLQSLKVVRGDDGKPIVVDGISVDAYRDDDPKLPRAGREVYLRVVVALKTKKDGSPIVLGRTNLTLATQLVVYPREVGSFALLVPRDLHLDSTWDAGMSPGDISLHKFSSRAEVGDSTGLVFQSPVFVNRNIHIPVDTSSAGTSLNNINYSAVTFADRVYLGNGWIMSNGSLYSPSSAGGMTDRYWADARTFGGFLKGIENDGGLDKGLDVFKNGPGSTSSSLFNSLTLMKQCIEHTQMLSSKDNLYKSELGAWLNATDNQNFDYRFFLSRGNEFVRQWNSLIVNKSYWSGGKVDIDSDMVTKGGAVAKFRLDVADKYVEVQLPYSGTVKLTVPVGSAAYKLSLENSVKSAQSTYDLETAKYDTLVKALSDARANLKDAQADLDKELAKPIEPAKDPDPKVDYQDPAKVAALEAKVASIKKQISDLENNKIPAQQSVVNTATKNLDLAKSNLSYYLDLVSNPPVVQITTSRVVNKKGYTSPDKLDVSVDVNNAKAFVNSKGELVAPVLGIQAYDGSYYKSYSITDPPNGNLLSYLNFSFDASKTKLVAPYNVSRSPGGSAINLVDSGVDYGNLQAECEAARNAQVSQSFGGAGWSTDFSGGTRASWNFAGGTTAGQDPVLAQLILKDMHRSNATFQVRSIVGSCIIESSADFVTGFFTCDSLEIQERTTPLRIIGTFIVGKMRIHPSAIKAGITWSSIYHPQATRELRAAKILKSYSGRDCNLKSSDPIWHPIPSVEEVSDRMGCNSISLRSKADPFQWTAVDPDCGIPPGSTSSNTSCKRRLIRFYVVEQSRESGI